MNLFFYSMNMILQKVNSENKEVFFTALLEKIYPMSKNFNQRLVGIGTTQPLGKGFNQLGLVNF